MAILKMDDSRIRVEDVVYTGLLRWQRMVGLPPCTFHVRQIYYFDARFEMIENRLLFYS